MLRPMPPRHAGFTLLEMLVAIAIFAVLAVSAYSVLSNVQTTNEVSMRHADRLANLQRTYFTLSRDLTQMAHRKVRTDGDEPVSRLLFTDLDVLDSSSGSIMFTRHGWTNPFNQFPRGDVQRVGYRVQDDQLQRVYYLYPDIVNGVEPKVQTLLTGVNKLSFEYFRGGKWQEEWTSDRLPRGIAVILDTEEYGQLRWQFLVPGKGGSSGQLRDNSDDF